MGREPAGMKYEPLRFESRAGTGKKDYPLRLDGKQKPMERGKNSAFNRNDFTTFCFWRSDRRCHLPVAFPSILSRPVGTYQFSHFSQNCRETSHEGSKERRGKGGRSRISTKEVKGKVAPSIYSLTRPALMNYSAG